MRHLALGANDGRIFERKSQMKKTKAARMFVIIIAVVMILGVLVSAFYGVLV